MNDFTGLQKAKQSIKAPTQPNKGIVVDINPERGGVKVRRYGSKEAADIYYNTLQPVNVGDKVFMMEDSGTWVIVGKLWY